MKSQISTLRFAVILTLLLLLGLAAPAALPPPSAITVMVNTNGELIAPTNFWAKSASGIAAATTNSWTLAVVPDTQYYSNTTFAAIATYLQSIRYSRNLKMVLTTGDVVDDPTSVYQRDNATNLFYAVRGAGLPHLITAGNHDYTSAQWWVVGAASYWSAYWGPPYYAGQSWFNGSYYGTNTESAFITQRIAGEDWLFLSLKMGPLDAQAAWAAGVITNHPTHRVVIATHLYERPEGTRDGVLARNGAYSAGIHDPTYGSPLGNDAEELWYRYFKACPNIVIITSSHYGFTLDKADYAYNADVGFGRNIAYGIAGNAVHEIFANYQNDFPNTTASRQGGWVRLYTFTGNSVHAETYSVAAATNKFGNAHDFTFDIGQSQRVPGAKNVNALSEYTRTIAVPDSELADGLFFYAPLNEQWGTNIVEVISGNVGNPYARPAQTLACSFTTNGLRGSALEFGNWSHVDFGNVPSPYLSALSCSVWFRSTSLDASGVFIGRHNGSTDSQFAFTFTPVTPQVSVSLTSITPTVVSRAFALPQNGLDGAWHHYAFVYDGTNVTAYFDGQSLGAQAGPTGGPFLNTSTRSMWLGDYQIMGGGDEYCIIGTLDEPKLWSRALSAAEITYLATSAGPQLGLSRVSTVQSLAAGTKIKANAPIVRVVGSGGAVTLTGTPTIVDGVDGQELEIWGTSDSNTVAIQDNDTLPGSNIQEPGTVRTLGLGDVMILRFDSTTGFWYETGSSYN